MPISLVSTLCIFYLSKNHYMKPNLLFSFIITIFSSLSLVSYSQTPPLGSAASFAVFTAVGAINNTGPTVVTGDIGTDVGAYNGFPPGTVNGGVYNENSVSATAAMDVQTAYGSFAPMTCGSSIGPTIGNGQILAPGVYCLGGASTLEGNLTLDAEGNGDAIFIFKIGGAFSTSVLTNIILINGASPCNIYWQVNGQFTLGDFSQFYGTVINDGAIILLNNAIIDGRVLSVGGAITMSTNQVNNVCSLPLPVKMVTFTAECIDKDVHLSWLTASEVNNQYFSVEKSNNAKEWQEIGIVDGNGNTSKMSGYYYIDHGSEIYSSFYRLKQFDYDGRYSYSNVINIRNCGDEIPGVNVFPNPTSEKLYITFNNDKDNFISSSLYNPSGKLIFHSTSQESTFDFSDTKNGIYILQLHMQSGIFIKKITVTD